VVTDSEGRHAPDLAAQIRIVRDGREVYSAPAKIAGAIPPGEYYMQVVATDGARKNTTAEQWTDFQVLPEVP
jgi:hypothetical protein